MESLLLLIMGVINIICFYFGAKVGQAVSKGEEIRMPSVNPFEAYRKHEERKQAEMEQDKFDTIMGNIERYDGTGKGQEDVGR